MSEPLQHTPEDRPAEQGEEIDPQSLYTWVESFGAEQIMYWSHDPDVTLRAQVTHSAEGPATFGVYRKDEALPVTGCTSLEDAMRKYLEVL